MPVAGGGELITFPYLVVVLGVISVSGASILFRFATAPPLVMAFYRLAFSTVLVSIPLLFQKSKSLKPLDAWLSVISGLFLGIHFASWFVSLSRTSIFAATVLVNMHPFFVLLGGYFVQSEKVTKASLLGVCLAVLGATLVGWGDFTLDRRALVGDLLAFVGALTASAYLWIGRHVRQRIGTLSYSAIAYSAATITLFFMVLGQGTSFWRFESFNWWLAIALAVFPTLFGHTLFHWALRYVSISVVSVNILGEPIGATLLAWLIWGIRPGVTTLLGGSMILIGIAVFLWFRRAIEKGTQAISGAAVQ